MSCEFAVKSEVKKGEYSDMEFFYYTSNFIF